LRWKTPGGGSVIDINRLLQRLCDADIDFVIVGGFAATLHGSSLVTRDLDVCAILSSENVAKLRDALRDREFDRVRAFDTSGAVRAYLPRHFA
jgi:molybdopterin-guanine dinucleotide biosynthesis protein